MTNCLFYIKLNYLKFTEVSCNLKNLMIFRYAITKIKRNHKEYKYRDYFIVKKIFNKKTSHEITHT